MSVCISHMDTEMHQAQQLLVVLPAISVTSTSRSITLQSYRAQLARVMYMYPSLSQFSSFIQHLSWLQYEEVFAGQAYTVHSMPH